jgi:hypothetical protein
VSAAATAFVMAEPTWSNSMYSGHLPVRCVAGGVAGHWATEMPMKIHFSSIGAPSSVATSFAASRVASWTLGSSGPAPPRPPWTMYVKKRAWYGGMTTVRASGPPSVPTCASRPWSPARLADTNHGPPRYRYVFSERALSSATRQFVWTRPRSAIS